MRLTDQQFESLKQDLNDYKKKKDASKSKIEQIKKDVREGKRMYWNEE